MDESKVLEEAQGTKDIGGTNEDDNEDKQDEEKNDDDELTGITE
jgi:hypothetical protein